jgi:RHH-type transcriptional regulator, proline utilization regulon repressor / proline dehydrogenase / delta 1-pyrroline-5-carboxylate dehydrogenase
MGAPPELSQSSLREIAQNANATEAEVVERLGAIVPFDAIAERVIEREALALAEAVRNHRPSGLSAEAFLGHFGLATREGIALMCLAESLLRIPDTPTADRLLADKLAGTDWSPQEADENFLLNAATWGLMLTGRLYDWRSEGRGGIGASLASAVKRLGEPVARTAVRQAMRIMAVQFIAAEQIEDAVAAAPAKEAAGFRFSYDMLGEGAKTEADAARYFEAYRKAIAAVGGGFSERPPFERAGISVKLSALHPRFEPAKRDRIMSELLPRLRSLAISAKAGGVPLTIDAEEADRLLPTLELFETIACDPALADWDGLGIAVQAYSKRAYNVCEWLISLSKRSNRRIPVRLVKGAYWDTEIKHAQVQGLNDYPVFTRKAATDLSYLACAHRLLSAPKQIFPAFATHNCHTVAAVLHLARDVHGTSEFEFQKLQGMGDALYDSLMSDAARRTPVRVYAPIGSHRDLLAYLVRRMLENGANSSFVHQITDAKVPLEQLVANPRSRLPRPYTSNPRVPLPANIFADRRNSKGVNLADDAALEEIHGRVVEDRKASMVEKPAPPTVVVREPANIEYTVGTYSPNTQEELNIMIQGAQLAFQSWTSQTADARAVLLERTSRRVEENWLELVSLLVREAGKTYGDAVAEVRETVDFLRYYAVEARRLFGAQTVLSGPTGERNTISWHGRGVFACISPWNFPLAIFTGQIAAALAAGNTVVAKPAEQTPLIAQRMIGLFHTAGIPRDALALALGTGEAIGAPLVADPRIAGVAFTGSVPVAQQINRTLAARNRAIVPLIAETGGLNAMIVDSSALPEQVVADAITSAFQSAGQRCSALRILALQSSTAERTIQMLGGAMRELKLGDPGHPDTDVGPVIDPHALSVLAHYRAKIAALGKQIGEVPTQMGTPRGFYFPPVAYEVPLAALPNREIFGPILHVVRYEPDELPALLQQLAATGFGLTLGIASRIDRFIDEVTTILHAGNTYVNRNMIGAVVGVQPFGGEGLSGTGPKAGGPNYLTRFATERTLTINTTAIGGNAALLSDG